MKIANPVKTIDMGRSNRTPIAYSGEAILYEDGTINNYYGNVSVLKSLQLLSVVETKPMGFLGGGNSPKSLIREKIKDSDNEPIVSSRSLLSRVILFLGFPLLIIFLISSGIDDGREASGFLLIPYMMCAFFLVFTTDEIRNGYDENFLRFNRPIVEKYSEIEIYVAGESERFSIRLCTCQQLRWITLFRFISTFYVGTFIISFLFLGYAEIYVIDNPIIFLLVCIFWLMTSFLELNQGTFYVGGFLLWLQYPRGRENYDGIDKQFFITESSSYEFYEIALKTIEDNSNLEGVEIKNIIEQPETEVLEFKSSVWAQYNNNSGELIDKQKSKSLALEDSIIKTIAAFLNTQGGKLIIGVQDRPKRKVVGIEADFQYSGKSKDIESFQNSLTNAIKTATNDPAIVGTYVEISIEIIEGKSICAINVKQKAPKSWTYVNMKNWKDKGEKKECFFVRSGPSSNLIDSRKSADEWKSARIEMQEYEGN